jgi:hypothetical protein
MTDVRQAIPTGNEKLDNLTVELAGNILEQLAGLIVDEDNGPRLVNDERSVRYLREEVFQTLG